MSKRLIKPSQIHNKIIREINKTTIDTQIPTLKNARSIPKLDIHNRNVLEGQQMHSKISENAGKLLPNFRDKVLAGMEGNRHANRDTSDDNPLLRAVNQRKKADVLRGFTHSVSK